MIEHKVGRFLSGVVISLGVGCAVYCTYTAYTLSNNDSLQSHDIQNTINASGVIVLKDWVEICSSVSGSIQKIAVEEGEQVKKGQLLALIDTGIEDTEVREVEGALEKSIAELEFQEKNYHRQLKLAQEQFVSDSELEEAKRDFLSAQADVKMLQASFDKKKLAFQSRQIFAPLDGEVIRIEGVVGSRISSDSEDKTILVIAPTQHLIEVDIDIPEKVCGEIRRGQKIVVTTDTYPEHLFESEIRSISYPTKRDENKKYPCVAKAVLDNSELLLRPGMSVCVRIQEVSMNTLRHEGK